MIEEHIALNRIIPVIALENAEDTPPLCAALKAGGLSVAEITFRTSAAPEAIRMVRHLFPAFIVGAGTVTQVDEVDAAAEAGAQFAVAPGFNPKVVSRAQALNLPFFPGVCTPSDVEAALESGCRTLKLFPAGVMGGVKMLEALYGPYSHRGVRFVPTGGINADNMNDFLAHPGVLAIGGSWMVNKALLRKKDWETVQHLTRQAVQSRT